MGAKKKKIMDKIKLIVLCGKAGVGKDATLHRVVELAPDLFNEIVSCTTRPPREGEIDGVHYHFLTIEQFTEKILSGDMLEATEFNGWHYGTMASSLSQDKINIGVFNPAGIAALLEDENLDITVFHITAKPKTRLIRQLNREEEPNVYEILRRFFTDEDDFLELDRLEFDNSNYYELSNEESEDLDINSRLIVSWATWDK